MKRKIFTIGTALALAFSATAQTEEVTNKNGVIVTPEAGDWALGFNAAPLLNYIGNTFNNTVGNSMGTAFLTTDQAIFGKYFVDASTAYRGSLRIMNMGATTNAQIDTNTINSGPTYVTNTSKASGSQLYLSAGLEKRRGHGRLQGYYGGEVVISLTGTAPKTSYTYAVSLDSTTMANNVTDAGASSDMNLNSSAMNGRVVSSKGGKQFGFGLRGFIGVEYFILPKISLGGEFGWGLMMNSTGAGETVKEYYGYDGSAATSKSNYTVTTTTAKLKSHTIDTDNYYGTIKLLFHF